VVIFLDILLPLLYIRLILKQVLIISLREIKSRAIRSFEQYRQYAYDGGEIRLIKENIEREDLRSTLEKTETLVK
jgi:hypothetical protein